MSHHTHKLIPVLQAWVGSAGPYMVTECGLRVHPGVRLDNAPSCQGCQAAIRV